MKLALTLTAVLTLPACGGSRESTPMHDAGGAATPRNLAAPASAAASAPVSAAASASAPASASASASAPASASASAPASAPAESPPPPGDPALARFHAALRDLAAGKRKAHVRVAWLGDSHGQADFWSGALRTALQKRFGNGGPGFVHVGWSAYRHDGIKLAVEGKWSIRPRAPASSKRVDDGIFGLGGVLTLGPAGAGHARVQVADELSGRLTWDLCYRLNAPQDALQATLGTGPTTNVQATATEPPGPLRHLVLVSNGADALRVAPTAGNPALCGVVIETDPAQQPGVVLDTLGINGARLGTPLAWDEPSFGAELARRPPSLVILEYGTNESGDHNVDPSVYTKKLVKLMERVRKFAPEAECLALAPTDRADTRERTPLVRDAIREGAQQASCSFWDTYAVMGGAGSISAWSAEANPRAAKDGVHLTPRGYREMGDALAAHVLRGL